jgi:hypothetical protein
VVAFKAASAHQTPAASIPDAFAVARIWPLRSSFSIRQYQDCGFPAPRAAHAIPPDICSETASESGSSEAHPHSITTCQPRRYQHGSAWHASPNGTLASRRELHAKRATMFGPTRGSSICQPGSRTRQLSFGKRCLFFVETSHGPTYRGRGSSAASRTPARPVETLAKFLCWGGSIVATEARGLYFARGGNFCQRGDGHLE